MKKSILFILAMSLLIAPIVYAGDISPGNNGSSDSCTVWRESIGTPYVDPTTRAKTGNWCSGNTEDTKRLYELEVAVQHLQRQINNQYIQPVQSCQCPVSSNTTTYDNSGLVALASRVQSLENKVFSIEQTLSNLQKTIGEGLRNIILILISKK
jgi:hypothetical protein